MQPRVSDSLRLPPCQLEPTDRPTRDIVGWFLLLYRVRPRPHRGRGQHAIIARRQQGATRLTGHSNDQAGRVQFGQGREGGGGRAGPVPFALHWNWVTEFSGMALICPSYQGNSPSFIWRSTRTRNGLTPTYADVNQFYTL